jgi:type I restriction enzyme S subunit
MGTVTKQKKNVPKLRFPEYKDEWREFHFGEVGRVSMCKRVLKSQTRPKGDVPFYTIGTFGKSASSYIDKGLYQDFKTKYSFPKKGDVLISAAGTIGRLVVYDGKPAYFQDSNIVWIENNESFVTNSFLLFCYKNTKWKTEDTTIARLYNDNLKNTKSLIPSLPEQQKIADFLGSVDVWLDNLRQQKAALETYKQGMMQKLFTRQVCFKDDSGKDFPEWESKILGDVFSATKGVGISKEDLDTDGINECILYGELYTTYAEVISKVKSRTNVNEGVRSVVGDLLIPCSTTTSAIDLVNLTVLNKEGVLLGGDITILRGKIEVSNVFYAYYLSNHKKHELAKYGQGVTIIHIYYSHFKDLVIDVPSFAEQQKIADFLTAIDQIITSKAEEISKVEQWKKGLMQKMFI